MHWTRPPCSWGGLKLLSVRKHQHDNSQTKHFRKTALPVLTDRGLSGKQHCWCWQSWHLPTLVMLNSENPLVCQHRLWWIPKISSPANRRHDMLLNPSLCLQRWNSEIKKLTHARQLFLIIASMRFCIFRPRSHVRMQTATVLTALHKWPCHRSDLYNMTRHVRVIDMAAYGPLAASQALVPSSWNLHSLPLCHSFHKIYLHLGFSSHTPGKTSSSSFLI